VEVYRRRPGRNLEDISGAAATHFLDVGAGTSDWREVRLTVPLAPDVACLLFTIVGEKFRGQVWLEDPQFPGPGATNTLPPFAPARPFAPFRSWLAQNLSRVEWPVRLSINEQEVFRGAVFQAIYRWLAWEVDIPRGVALAGSRTGWTASPFYNINPRTYNKLTRLYAQRCRAPVFPWFLLR
jgi:hypothetical protein